MNRFLISSVIEFNRFRLLNNLRNYSSLSQSSSTESSSPDVNLNLLNTNDGLKVKKTRRNIKKLVENDTMQNEEAQVSDLIDSKDKSIVLRKPIPKNFIKETLLPHLEHNVAYNCMKFPPDIVLQIGIAYSKLPYFIRQRAIEDALIEAFRHRMVDYTATDCIQLLNTCLKLQGLRSIAVYDDIISRLEVPHVFNSLNSLNRLGICRSVSKILNHSQKITSNSNNKGEKDETHSDSGKDYSDDLTGKSFLKVDFTVYNDAYNTSFIRPWSYFVKNYRDKKISNLVEKLINFCEHRILPQLEYELKSFDSDELTDLLCVLAQRSERDGTAVDFPVISILMSNIMRLYPTTSLLNNLNNLSSLCRLRIRHDPFLSLVVSDLKNPLKVNNIYHKHLSRCVWSLARYDLLNDVIPDMMVHIVRNVPKFEASCFARLSQISRYYQFSDEKLLSKFNNQLLKSCLFLLTKLNSFTPKDIIFFISGIMNMRLIPDEASYLNNLRIDVKPKFEKDERYLTKNNKSSNTLSILTKVLDAINRLESDFDLCEIERLIETTRSFKEYEYLLDHFPESWKNIIHPHEQSN